jgi:hypothetical protein
MPLISTVRLVLNITWTSFPATPPLAPLSTREGDIPWCSLWYDTLYSRHAVCTERLEVLDMTQHISPGGSGLGLLPFAAFIKTSAGGSGSRSADSGASSAMASSGASSSSSSNASRNSCNNAFLDLEEGLFVRIYGTGYA